MAGLRTIDLKAICIATPGAVVVAAGQEVVAFTTGNFFEGLTSTQLDSGESVAEFWKQRGVESIGAENIRTVGEGLDRLYCVAKPLCESASELLTTVDECLEPTRDQLSDLVLGITGDQIVSDVGRTIDQLGRWIDEKGVSIKAQGQETGNTIAEVTKAAYEMSGGNTETYLEIVRDYWAEVFYESYYRKSPIGDGKDSVVAWNPPSTPPWFGILRLECDGPEWITLIRQERPGRGTMKNLKIWEGTANSVLTLPPGDYRIDWNQAPDYDESLVTTKVTVSTGLDALATCSSD